MRFYSLTLLTIVLAGCASANTTLTTSKNQHHHLIATSKTNGKSLESAVNQAKQYCNKQRLRLATTELKSNYVSIGAPKDFVYRTRIDFVCAPLLKKAT